MTTCSETVARVPSPACRPAGRSEHPLKALWHRLVGRDRTPAPYDPATAAQLNLRAEAWNREPDRWLW